MKNNNNIQEVWKPIDGFPGYEISNLGKVKSPNKILKTTPNYSGYHLVTLCNSKKYITPRVHRLVAKAFIPNPNNLPEVNHLDGDKSNNKASNLIWCSSKQNMRHAIETGLIKQKRLSLEEIKQIKFEYKNGKTVPELAKKFGISENGISRHLNEIKKRRKITKKLKEEILSLYSTGLYTQRELSFLFDVSKGSIYNILKESKRVV